MHEAALSWTSQHPMCSMEQTQNAAAKQRRVLHPFLFAVFPVLSLFSAHVGQVAASEVWPPLVAMTCISGALWMLLWPLLPEREKRGLAISVFLLAFFAYGPAIDYVRTSMGRRLAMSNTATGVAELSLLLIVVGGLFLLRRSRRSLERATAFLNATALCAVLIALAALCFKAWPAVFPAHQGPSAQPRGSTQVDGARLPDIYYIILDAYAREDILRDLLNYNNTEFISFLKDRGFYVAGDSCSNYAWTLYSLSSSLNLDYLNSGTTPDETQREFDLRIQQQFRRNKVIASLRQRGYRCISFTSSYSAAARSNLSGTWSR